MRAEILAIGDELVAGHRVDTNSSWLASQLRMLGVRPSRHVTVGDQLEELTSTIRELAARSDLVISTGGLGPTQDDLTRQALAAATERPLETDEAMIEHIRDLFKRRGRSMPDSNRVQAQRPAGSQWIPNPHGSAPGIDCPIDANGSRCRWFALPGVPAEMREMWHDTVAAAIRGELVPPQVIAVRELRCFGIGESSLEARLPRSLLRGENPEIGITVSRGTITLRITGHGRTAEEADAVVAPVVHELEQSLGHLVFGRGEQELEHVVIESLRKRGHTLVTCEGPSLGLLSRSLSAADPSGFIYWGGHVDPRLTDSTDDNDPSLLAEELESLLAETQASVALGIARSPADMERTHLAAIIRGDLFQKTIHLRSHPDIIPDLGAKHALNFLRTRWLS